MRSSHQHHLTTTKLPCIPSPQPHRTKHKQVRPSAFNSTSPLAPLVTQARGLRRQREYAQAIALLRSVVRGKRAAAQGEGEEGENMGEAERGDLGWLGE